MRNDIKWNGNEALGYFRCSKDEQSDSIPGQHMIVDPELARHGLRLRVAPFEDDGRRGSDEERPAFLALLEYCRAHPLRPRAAADFVPIFTQSTDRIGRFLQPMKLFTYLNELRDLGYDMYSITEGITYVRSNIGEWIQFVVRSDQATGYSVRLSHDSMRGGIQTSKLGFLAGGSPGYGYDRAVVGPDGEPRARYRNIPGKRVEKYSMDGQLLLVLKPIEKKAKLIAPTLDKSNTDHSTERMVTSLFGKRTIFSSACLIKFREELHVIEPERLDRRVKEPSDRHIEQMQDDGRADTQNAPYALA